MTLLRSGKIIATVNSRSPRKTLEKSDMEPATPVKVTESSNHQSSPTPNSSPSELNPSHLVLGSDSVSHWRTVPRRSHRFVSELNFRDVVGSFSVPERKRKSLTAGNSSICNNDTDLDSVKINSAVVADNGALGLERKKARVSSQDRKMVRVSEELSIVMESEQKEMGIDLKKLDLGGEEVTVLGDSALSSGLGSSRRRSKRIMNATKATGKRKMDSHIDSSISELMVEDNMVDECLVSRIEMNTSYGIMEGSGGGLVRVASDDGEKLVRENKSGGNCKDNGAPNGATGETILTNELLEGELRFDGNGNCKGRRNSLNGEKGKGRVKGKGKVGTEALMLSSVDQQKTDLEPKAAKLIGKLDSDTDCLLDNVAEEDLEVSNANGSGTSSEARVKFSSEERGKEKVEADGLLSNGPSLKLNLGSIEYSKDNATLGLARLAENVTSPVERSAVDANRIEIYVTDHKKRSRDFAKRNASRFAHSSSQEEEENHVNSEAERELSLSKAHKEIEDWPGPFSTAMKIVKDREMNLNVRPQDSSLDESKQASLIWSPRNDRQQAQTRRSVLSLEDLCIKILAQNTDAITSLDGIPESLRHKLSQLLCDSRRMDSHFLNLLVRGSPTEVCMKDCSWLTEEQFLKSFEGCDTCNLKVLQLDQSGRCLPDYTMYATFGRLSNKMPALTYVSLKGACRLSDAGLSALISSAPALTSINLSQCSLLTFAGVKTLADSLGSVLKKLYLDDCQNIEPMSVLPALKKLQNLEVLSLAGIQAICDDFIHDLITVRGPKIKELVLADCMQLTDSSLKDIAQNCSGLRALNLMNLCKLTDSSIAYLANGCQGLQTLKFCRNVLSDEAIAAFLETSGESLRELSLNNVIKVGQNTALSLARCSKNLRSLDLSWCRNLTDNSLGLIVDSCSSLNLLKLFGCTQITKVFLDGHSNQHVKVIGLSLTPILDHLGRISKTY